MTNYTVGPMGESKPVSDYSNDPLMPVPFCKGYHVNLAELFDCADCATLLDNPSIAR